MIIPGTIISMVVVTILLFNVSAGFSFPASAAAAAPEASKNPNLPTAANRSDLQAQPTGEASCKVSQSFPASILQWCEWITHYSEARGLAPDLVAALIWQESGGDHLAYSQSGAVGLMQVMPRDGLAASFNCVNGPCFASRPTTQELEDPEFNIAYGAKYLAQQVTRQGNIRDALKAYGPMNVGFYYADKVLGIYETYRTQN
jgi:soluble lytic murein transglycosylase-like protein